MSARLAILSDLHLDVQPYEHPIPDADVLVLAGDIDRKLRGVAWAASAFQDRPVVYVPGNHESYGDSLPRHTEKLREAGEPRKVHVLDRESVVLDGVRFLGATLWTDFALLGDARSAMAAAADPYNGMRDYRHIRLRPQYRRLSPRDTAAMHAATVSWLRRTLSTPFDGPTVVVTHHAPSVIGCNPQLHGDPIIPAYASALDDLVKESGAALWVHGHTHWAHDTMFGRTRLLSNPRGYPDECITDFRPELVVSV